MEIIMDRGMKIGSRVFDTENRTYIMGILNVTPDSFSDGGSYKNMDMILKRAETMIEEGADIIDVGGESTRPGYVKITDEEEAARVIPVIERIHCEFDVPISVDTYKSDVARVALQSGAHVINDIWGLKYDKDMARVISDAEAVCCLMHNRKEIDYRDFFSDCLNDLNESAAIAIEAGIRRDRIILDPGVGFSKTGAQNLQVIKRLNEFNRLGYPILLGASRKSVIGLTLDLPVSKRLEGTIVTSVFAALNHCAFARVHDVKENKRAIAMAEAIINS